MAIFEQVVTQQSIIGKKQQELDIINKAREEAGAPYLSYSKSYQDIKTVKGVNRYNRDIDSYNQTQTEAYNKAQEQLISEIDMLEPEQRYLAGDTSIERFEQYNHIYYLEDTGKRAAGRKVYKVIGHPEWGEFAPKSLGDIKTGEYYGKGSSGELYGDKLINGKIVDESLRYTKNPKTITVNGKEINVNQWYSTGQVIEANPNITTVDTNKYNTSLWTESRSIPYTDTTYSGKVAAIRRGEQATLTKAQEQAKAQYGYIPKSITEIKDKRQQAQAIKNWIEYKKENKKAYTTAVTNRLYRSDWDKRATEELKLYSDRKIEGAKKYIPKFQSEALKLFSDNPLVYNVNYNVNGVDIKFSRDDLKYVTSPSGALTLPTDKYATGKQRYKAYETTKQAYKDYLGGGKFVSTLRFGAQEFSIKLDEYSKLSTTNTKISPINTRMAGQFAAGGISYFTGLGTAALYPIQTATAVKDLVISAKNNPARFLITSTENIKNYVVTGVTTRPSYFAGQLTAGYLVGNKIGKGVSATARKVASVSPVKIKVLKLDIPLSKNRNLNYRGIGIEYKGKGTPLFGIRNSNIVFGKPRLNLKNVDFTKSFIVEKSTLYSLARTKTPNLKKYNNEQLTYYYENIKPINYIKGNRKLDLGAGYVLNKKATDFFDYKFKRQNNFNSLLSQAKKVDNKYYQSLLKNKNNYKFGNYNKGLPYESKTFSKVYSDYSLDIFGKKRAYKNVYRVLKDRGQIYIKTGKYDISLYNKLKSVGFKNVKMTKKTYKLKSPFSDEIYNNEVYIYTAQKNPLSQTILNINKRIGKKASISFTPRQGQNIIKEAGKKLNKPLSKAAKKKAGQVNKGVLLSEQYDRILENYQEFKPFFKKNKQQNLGVIGKDLTPKQIKEAKAFVKKYPYGAEVKIQKQVLPFSEQAKFKELGSAASIPTEKADILGNAQFTRLRTFKSSKGRVIELYKGYTRGGKSVFYTYEKGIGKPLSVKTSDYIKGEVKLFEGTKNIPQQIGKFRKNYPEGFGSQKVKAFIKNTNDIDGIITVKRTFKKPLEYDFSIGQAKLKSKIVKQKPVIVETVSRKPVKIGKLRPMSEITDTLDKFYNRKSQRLDSALNDRVPKLDKVLSRNDKGFFIEEESSQFQQLSRINNNNIPKGFRSQRTYLEAVIRVNKLRQDRQRLLPVVSNRFNVIRVKKEGGSIIFNNGVRPKVNRDNLNIPLIIPVIKPAYSNISAIQPKIEPIISVRPASININQNKNININRNRIINRNINTNISKNINKNINKNLSKSITKNINQNVSVSNVVKRPNINITTSGNNKIKPTINFNINIKPIVTPTPTTTPKFGINLKRSSFEIKSKVKNNQIFRQRKAYTPTGFAASFGIKGRATKLGSTSGLGFRPIISKRGLF